MDNESRLKLENEINNEILKLRKRLKIAEEALKEIGYPGYLTPWYQPWQKARLTLEDIKKIK